MRTERGREKRNSEGSGRRGRLNADRKEEKKTGRGQESKIKQ